MAPPTWGPTPAVPADDVELAWGGGAGAPRPAAPAPGEAPAPLLGDALVVSSQVVQALQLILEEGLLRGAPHVTPAAAVGIEGAWGLGYVVLFAAATRALPAAARPDDVAAGVAEMLSHGAVLAPAAGVVLAIAAFNLSGMVITRRVSGASRATIDASRTAVVWALSLGLGWEPFRAPELLGFAVLLAGTAVYNELLTRAALAAAGGGAAAAWAGRAGGRAGGWLAGGAPAGAGGAEGEAGEAGAEGEAGGLRGLGARVGRAWGRLRRSGSAQEGVL